MGSQLGAARLLYAMGRSNAIPKSFFGVLDPVRQTPRNNVLFAGALALAGALTIRFERGVELLNFGALIAFMGVNLSALMHYYVRASHKKVQNLLTPMCGFFVCLLLWWNLNMYAKIAGIIWMVASLAYGALRTGWFQGELINFDSDVVSDA
jgi:amino acid transporter